VETIFMPRGLWGERHRWTKLTAAQVRAIRASAEPTFVLARRYGVDWSAVDKIRKGKSWRHLDDDPAEVGVEPFAAPGLPEDVLAIRLGDGSLALIDAVDAPLVVGRYWFVRQWTRGSGAVVCNDHSDGTHRILTLHRLITHPGADERVIHRDGDVRNCRRANLAVVEEGVDHHRSRLYRRNRSGYKGVSFSKRKDATGRPWRGRSERTSGSLSWATTPRPKSSATLQRSGARAVRRAGLPECD
jgi:hypothetical protein